MPRHRPISAGGRTRVCRANPTRAPHRGARMRALSQLSATNAFPSPGIPRKIGVRYQPPPTRLHAACSALSNGTPLGHRPPTSTLLRPSCGETTTGGPLEVMPARPKGEGGPARVVGSKKPLESKIGDLPRLPLRPSSPPRGVDKDARGRRWSCQRPRITSPDKGELVITIG
ncbi:hypothetical protein LZ30DRAFT_325780 [Colletotrichum cereale]|nr:hypothetical protein LZ30DRAFT_325780 [Colletotrichum cereale]